MAFNLFGDLAADLELADRAVHTWWPDAPGTVREVRFAHSPGRFDPAYLNSLRAFDVAFVLDLGDGTQGIVAARHQVPRASEAGDPKPSQPRGGISRSPRGRASSRPGAIDAVKGRSDLAVMWLEHLLLLSMLQHPSGTWSWGRYVVVHPAGNSDFADACARYRDLLADESTFASDDRRGAPRRRRPPGADGHGTARAVHPQLKKTRRLLGKPAVAVRGRLAARDRGVRDPSIRRVLLDARAVALRDFVGGETERVVLRAPTAITRHGPLPAPTITCFVFGGQCTKSHARSCRSSPSTIRTASPETTRKSS